MNKFLQLRKHGIEEYITYDKNSLNVCLLNAQSAYETSLRLD